MRILALILITMMFSGIVAKAQMHEIAPGVKPSVPVIQEDSFNLYYSFPAIAFIGEYGAESNGNTVYATQWMNDSLASYDMSGNIIERFVIQGVEKVRDLAYDGQYYYGSPSAFYFYVLDLDNKSLIDTVSVSFRIRGMAYDPLEDVLWASEHWSPMFYKMDKQGNILDSWLPTGITMDAISGLAFDNYSPNGPFLWGFSQDSTGAVIVKYDVPAKAQTGNMIDVSSLGNNMTYAGGLYLEELGLRGIPVIGGVIQNQLHFALDLDYANMLVGLDQPGMDIIPDVEIYPNPTSDYITIKTGLNNTSAYKARVLNQLGQVQIETILNLEETRLDLSELQSGVYFLQINNIGSSYTYRLVKEK